MILVLALSALFATDATKTYKFIATTLDFKGYKFGETLPSLALQNVLSVVKRQLFQRHCVLGCSVMFDQKTR